MQELPALSAKITITIEYQNSKEPEIWAFAGQNFREEAIQYLSRNSIQVSPMLRRNDSGLMNSFGRVALKVGKATAIGIEKATNPETGIIGRKYAKEKKKE